MRKGLPTVRIRTLDHEGNVTGVVLLDPTAARQVPANVEIHLENLATILDPTGGYSPGGLFRTSTEDGELEISSAADGDFDIYDLLPRD